MTKSNCSATKNFRKPKHYEHNICYYRICNSLILYSSDIYITDTESAVRNKLIYLLTELKGVKFVKTLVLEFKKNRK